MSDQLHAPIVLIQVLIQLVAGWAPELMWTFIRKEKCLSLVGIEARTAQSVVLVCRVPNTKFSFNAEVSIAELERSSVAMHQRRRRHNGEQSWDKKNALYNSFLRPLLGVSVTLLHATYRYFVSKGPAVAFVLAKL